ncbi:MAG: MFS transporter [Gemmataceae bacterium]
MGRVTVGPHEPDSSRVDMPRRRLFAICGLLLLASAINYMDRQTLANVSTRVTREFSLTEQQYGALETSFGLSFAAGSLVLGMLADRVSIRFVYPLVLLLWSSVGFLTGWTQSYGQLLVCRGLLGFFEAGHWPCGLKAIQLLLVPDRRAMGNSVLQSGTSIGAIVTPLIMLATLTPEVSSWRMGFQWVGAIGFVWIGLWFLFVHRSDFSGAPARQPHSTASDQPWWRDFLTRRMLVVVLIVCIINVTWQTLRAWLPKIMLQEYLYDEKATAQFTSAWYIATDVGCLASGALAMALASRGWGIKSSRVAAFGLCAALCSSLMLMPLLSRGPLLLAVLLISGAGALGMFPIYYSFTQDISRNHQGKVAGFTGVLAWSISSPMAMLFGWLADETNSFNTGIAIAGALPLLAWLTIVFLWPRDNPPETSLSSNPPPSRSGSPHHPHILRSDTLMTLNRHPTF